MGLFAAGALVYLPGFAAATLSVPTPHYCWDVGNNGSPDADAYTIRTAGNDTYWTTGRQDRIVAAITEWDDDTPWNPNYDLSAGPADCLASLTCHGLWIDGSQPPAACGGAFVIGELARNCRKSDDRVDAEGTPYTDIKDNDIYFFTSGSGHPTWTYSSTGSIDDDVYDFQGILTHEIGHSIRLYDLGVMGRPACAPGGTLETMCGVIPTGWQSTQQRTLVADDKTSADVVY